MALAEEIKKGGPYTKKEQDERRQEVFKLHFEKGYSASKIFEMLKVNRNTINEDIRYWYSELASELNHDVTTWAIERYHNLELQKNRLVEQLEKEESIQYKIALEKLIFQINDKLSQFVSKIISSDIVIQNPKNEEVMEKTKDFVRSLLLGGKKETSTLWTKDDILFAIIKKYKCDLTYANSIFSNMEKLGSELCKTKLGLFDEYETKYDVLQFAEMRDFLSDNEIHQIRKRLDKL